ncbi:MAG: Gfo/Idh/MocA family oxidoreductase [Bryobacteraceae bacterium]|jgi:predicted dehydrogenase
MLNWLVAGVGDIAKKRVLPAILAEPRSKLAGLVTRDPARAAPYGVPGWRSLDEALAESGADAVYIATPVFLHAPQSIASLHAGKHVLCEKPMALNYAQACAIERAAYETGRTLGIAYYRRLYPKVDRARELLAAGAIGQPFLAEATSHDWFYPAGTARDWLIDPKRSGAGPLHDIATHRIDLMNYLFGKPVRAGGYASTLAHPIEVEDNATVWIEYATGVRGIVDVRWHSRVPRDEFRIRGTEGEMDLSPLNGPSIVWPGGREELPPHPNLHYPSVHNFVNAVLDGEPLRSTGASALPTAWVTGEVMDGPGYVIASRLRTPGMK